jgi:hypothetical protein
VIDPRFVYLVAAFFPACILVADLIAGLLIVSNVGPRLRGESHGVTNPKLA